jgi:GDP-L-fucose synthase
LRFRDDKEKNMINKNAKIYIAGHRGLVGSAIVRRLGKDGYNNLITRTRQELDLTDQLAVKEFFEKEKPKYVFLAAAKVGGIMANNTYPAEFIYINLQIEANIIHFAHLNGVKKLLFLGSSCIYPKFAPQPMKEEHLLTGILEPTNEPYAIAKIAGIKMCEAYNRQYGDNPAAYKRSDFTRFISVMPTNLYGPGDNFDLETSHVLPAIIRKFHEAKLDNNRPVELWGTGSPMREFLHVDDLANACVYLMDNYNELEFVNVGTGTDVTIKELAETIQKVVGHKGEVKWDSSKPDGTPRKLLDVSKLHSLGWKHSIELEEGIKSTYEWYLENYNDNK